MNLLVHAGIRAGLVAYNALLCLARAVRRGPRRPGPDGARILLTGTFRSDAWVEHHLRPLTRSSGCARVTMVATGTMPAIDKVVLVNPPVWLVRIAGSAGARLIVFAVLAFRERPDIVGGFHLLFNGLAAALIAPLAGARSLYFCVGGQMEVLDGGIRAENQLFNRLRTADRVIERLLVKAVRSIDIVVTMGHGAASFFQDRGVGAEFHVIPGGLDPSLYRPSDEPPVADIIFVGRLEPIKRPFLLLEAIARVKMRLPHVTALVVGDGQLRPALEDMARCLGLESTVTFAGHRPDVRELLPRSRVFVLTSESEGVALSLMEALACGVPAVVAQVGDLADVLVDGVNGYLVDSDRPEAFAVRILELLGSDARRRALAVAARRGAQAYSAPAITRRWDAVFGAGQPADPAVELTAVGEAAASSGIRATSGW